MHEMEYSDRFDEESLRELKVLEHVEQTPRLNNRKAASILGVSLHVAHHTIKKMVSKGLLHIQQENQKKWNYFLTAEGLAEKSRLTMEFLDFSMHFYRAARRQSAKLCKDLSVAGKKNIAFLGANELAEVVYLGVQEWDLNLRAVYDDGHDEDARFMNLPIHPRHELSPEAYAAVIVCLYDPAQPTAAHFLPAGLADADQFYWVFE